MAVKLIPMVPLPACYGREESLPLLSRGKQITRGKTPIRNPIKKPRANEHEPVTFAAVRGSRVRPFCSFEGTDIVSQASTSLEPFTPARVRKT